MNKAQLIEAIASKTTLSKKEAHGILETITDTIKGSLKGGEKVSIPGFGTFHMTDRLARTGRNPRTGETIQIKAKKVVKFKPSSKLVL
jgi:DNA-binding protein HU-beta